MSYRMIPAIVLAAVLSAVGVTSFGNYEFKAERPGLDPLFGTLPHRLNGTYMALDIHFFCPALFFNLREAFPYYEFDLQKRVVRYRKKESDPWVEYRPAADESARAQKFFAGTGN